MRLPLLALALTLPLAACAPAETDVTAASEPTSYAVSDEAGVVTVGEAPSGPVVTADDLVARADELDGQTLTVEGTVAKVCQNKGCWMTLQTASGETVRILVPKDEAGAYRYTFPADLARAQARLQGAFSVEEESVETRRHLAEDAGAGAEEVAAIAAPVRTLVLTATGARLVRPA